MLRYLKTTPIAFASRFLESLATKTAEQAILHFSNFNEFSRKRAQFQCHIMIVFATAGLKGNAEAKDLKRQQELSLEIHKVSYNLQSHSQLLPKS